jgi:hypothetical protein
MKSIVKYNDYIENKQKKLKSLVKIITHKYPTLKTHDRYIFLYYVIKFLNIESILYITDIEYSTDIKDIIDAAIIINKLCFNSNGFMDSKEIMKLNKKSVNAFNEFSFKKDLYILTMLKNKNLESTTLTEYNIININNIIKEVLS